MNLRDRQDCERSFQRTHQLLSSGIFDPTNSGNPLQQSAFIDVIICLRDLIHKTQTYTKRIDFTDDILVNDYVRDVTDAITSIRDACCHIDSFKKSFDKNGNRGEYLVIYGRGCLMKIDDFEARGDYEDDIAIFYGRNRIYFHRHIIRALKQAHAQLSPLLTKRDA
jgi:hypothetical protein